MRHAALALVVAVIFPTAAHAGKGAAILIPPLELDYGMGSTLGGSAVDGAHTELLVGIHWASLAWKPTPIDVGVGLVDAGHALVPDYTVARSTSTSPTAPPKPDNNLREHGAYLDLAIALLNKPHFRTWLAGRTEWLTVHANHQVFPAHGFAVRLASELFAPIGVSGGGHGGFGCIVGTFALGMYVEASHRDISPELGPNAVTTGVTFRLPFIAGIVN